MPMYLLRIKAVNLENFVSDTEDLATIRGGGLLLREFPAYLLKDSLADADVVSQGGSSLVVLQEFAAAEDAQKKVNEALTTLATHDSYKFATFVGSSVPVLQLEGKDFQKSLRQTESICNQEQMARLDLSLPAPNRERAIFKKQRKVFCDIDNVRPREVISLQSDDTNESSISGIQVSARSNAIVCNSVEVRRKFGRKRKQSLLKELAGLPKQGATKQGTGEATAPPLLCIADVGSETVLSVDRTTWHFEHLAAGGRTDSPLSAAAPDIPQRLVGKMAVLYFDGNGFTKREDMASESKKSLHRWDSELQETQTAIIKSLLKKIEAKSGGWLVQVKTRRDGQQVIETQLRFETLLWGGDDIIWVVPAWKALEFASDFFETASHQKLMGSRPTFSAGMVLASHKVPIRDTVALATRLLESAKQASRNQGDRNLLAYQVLESFDHLGEEFEQLRAATRPPMLSASDCVLNEQTLKLLLEIRQKLSHPDGRGMIAATRRHAIRNALQRGDLLQIERQFGRLFQVTGMSTELQEYVSLLPAQWQKSCLPVRGRNNIVVRDSLAVWMHLFDLWDYLPLQKADHE